MDRERALPVATAAGARADGAPASRPRPLPPLLLGLGLATLAFDLGSFFFKAPAIRRGVTVGDLSEAAGVFAVLLLYRAVARAVGAARGLPGLLLEAAAIGYAFGHGIHLAANSIHDMLDHTGLGDPWGLADFWDERAGHLLVDGARIAFAVSLTWSAAAASGGADARPRAEAGGRAGFDPAVALGAAAYGFLYFAAAVEGGTVALAFPFCLGYAAWSAASKSASRGGPVVLFYRIAAWVAILFLTVWGIGHRGFPEFSRVGFGF